MDGQTQEAAAAASGVSVRSGRTWETGACPSEKKKKRTWRTRQDPLEGLWESVVVPLPTRDSGRRLQAKTVLAELRRHEPERFGSNRTLRTLQRRMRTWRAMHGPERDVVLPQEHPPGREGALDFTHIDELGVTIGGSSLPHLLFTFRSSNESSGSYPMRVLASERPSARVVSDYFASCATIWRATPRGGWLLRAVSPKTGW